MQRTPTLLRPMGMIALFAATTALHGQTTKDGTTLTWNRDIVVTDGSITSGALAFPAHSITVFESGGPEAFELWRDEYKPISSSITGTRTVKAIGARVPALSDESLIVLAEHATDRKSKTGRLTLAFLLNDSVALPDEDKRQERYMRGLAVKFNKAVVQGQIDRYQADLDKAQGKLSDTQGKRAKAQGNVAKANARIQKTADRRAKLQRDNAAVLGKISGLEKKFALSNDPKDLQRLTKERQKLARNESSMAKLLQQESKTQGDLNKHQGTVEKHSGTEQDHLESKEDLMRIISELKRKQDAIR